MHTTITQSATVLGLALALTLTGCSAPLIAPTSPDSPAAPAAPTDQGDNGDQSNALPPPSSNVDPAHPWPADTPRPNNIITEFSGGNPFGEGAVRSIEFTASTAEAHAYVDSVVAAGWEHMMGTSEAIIDDSGASVSWLLSKDGVTATISTENGKDATPEWTFAMLG